MMTERVRAAVLEDAFKMVIREFDMPDIGREDGLLKVEMVGVCGSDPGVYSGRVKLFKLPLIMGHEIIGRIAKIGDIASKRWGVVEGDRITVEANVRCGYCYNCLVGDYRFCDHNIGYGFTCSTEPPHLFGAYAEYMYLFPNTIPYKVSEKVPPEAAIMINAVISNAIRWGRFEGNFAIGDAVVIQGAGRQGLALVIVAKESGCDPIIITGLATDKEKFKLAREFGAHYTINVQEEDVVERVRNLTGGHMADVVVDVTSSPKSIPVSIDLLKKRGSVIVPSLPHAPATIDIDKMVMGDIKLVTLFTSDARSMTRAVKLVESGKYPLEKMVTHKFPLDQAEKAVKATGGLLKDINPMKCVIIP
jgi:alcohol dehydrogenase